MIGADLGRFALIACIPIAVWTGFAGMGLLYGVVFAAGILTVLYQIASFAFLPSVVRPGQLVDANGKIAATQAASEIGGRGLGGLLIEVISAPAAVAVNAVAFLASALSQRRIRAGQLAEARDEQPVGVSSPWRDIGEGLRVAVSNRYVRALLGEATTFNLFNELFILGLMLYCVRDLGMGGAAIGLVFTAGGVGSFVGAWFGSRVTGRFGYGRVLLITLVVGNTVPLGVVLTGPAGDAGLALLCTIFAVMGVGIGVANVHAVSLRQLALPEHLRGQVNAAYRLISWGAIPLGGAVGGLVATHAGAQLAMVAGAAGMVLATLWVAFSAVPRLRTISDASDAWQPEPASAV
jgi:Na+/melibiose symporter-like transporter